MFVVQVVVALLNARADANAVTSDGRTALMRAALKGHDKVRGGTQRGERGVQVHTHTTCPWRSGRAEGVWGGGGVSCDPSRVAGAGAWARVYFLGRRLRGQWGVGSLWESPLKEEMTTLHQRRSCSPFNALPSAVLNV